VSPALVFVASRSFFPKKDNTHKHIRNFFRAIALPFPRAAVLRLREFANRGNREL